MSRTFTRTKTDHRLSPPFTIPEFWALFSELCENLSNWTMHRFCGDWCEDHEFPNEALAFRWLADNQRRPGHEPNFLHTDGGPDFWIPTGFEMTKWIRNDPDARLPVMLWETLSMYSEKFKPGLYKSYTCPSLALIDLVTHFKPELVAIIMIFRLDG